MTRTLRMLRAQLVVEQRIFWRNASTMFFTFVLPLVLLTMFVLGDADRENLSLIVALGILSTGFQGLAMQLAMHRDQGVLKGLMATPLPAGVFVAAKALSSLSVVVLETLVVLLVGVVVLGAPVPVAPLLLAAYLVVGTAAFTAIGFAVASIIPTSDSAPAIVNGTYLGLILASVVLAEVDQLPDVVQDAGAALPLGHLFGGVRDAWLGGGEAHLLGMAVLVAWGLLAAVWTVRRFRWEPAEAA